MERLLEGFFCVNSDFFSPKFRDSQPVGDALRTMYQIPTGARPTTNARFLCYQNSQTHHAQSCSDNNNSIMPEFHIFELR